VFVVDSFPTVRSFVRSYFNLFFFLIQREEEKCRLLAGRGSRFSRQAPLPHHQECLIILSVDLIETPSERSLI
jgi:hypothetical protein